MSAAKQVLRCAVRWGWIAKSPFDGLKPGSQASPARSFYVDRRTILDVLDACPSVHWKVVVGLCRFALLRRSLEVGSVTWADVNWEKGRLKVWSQKTEHHGADHAVRVVPIGPDLRLILDEAWSVAGRGQDSKDPGFTQEKRGGEQSTNAKSNAVPSDLAEVVAAWGRLPDAARAGIVAMVRASGG